jgi:thioredoxin reductase (NADPH)
MSESDMYDLVIIGGGPGGLSAGIYAMRAALETALIEMAVPGGQVTMSDSVENYPGFEHIGGAELSMKMAQHAKSYGLEILSQEVVSLEPGLEFHRVRFANGEQLRAHSVILAPGGSPRKLGIPGEKEYYGKGVSYCAVCDGFFFRNKTVVVIGGGDTAAEEALYLSKLAKQVYIVHRRDALRAGMILQQRVFAECKIEVLWNTVATAIKADDGGVYAVELKDTQTGEKREQATDGVFIFIGFEPNNKLVPAGTRMNADGYVVTDNRCETNTPGIFVIGDLREKYARQILIRQFPGNTIVHGSLIISSLKSLLFKFSILTAMLLGLPILGITLAGHPLSRYLEFPPQTLYVLPAPFFWMVFLGYSLFILAVCLSLAIKTLKSIKFSKHKISLSGVFPWWGWLGAASGVGVWILAWSRYSWFSAFQPHTFTPLWISYILVVNALKYQRTGQCMIISTAVSFERCILVVF